MAVLLKNIKSKSVCFSMNLGLGLIKVYGIQTYTHFQNPRCYNVLKCINSVCCMLRYVQTCPSVQEVLHKGF